MIILVVNIPWLKICFWIFMVWILAFRWKF